MLPVRLPIVVPAMGDDPPAALALRAEGLDVTVENVGGDDLAYGQMLARWWASGVGFILVEHDVVPWPGALRALYRCDLPFCGYDYPLGMPGSLGGALGCVRFSDELVADHPGLPANWKDVSWRGLDGAVIQAIAAATGQSYYHPHGPAVAHLRVF